MTHIKTILFVFMLCCLSFRMNGQYININDQRTAQDLISNVLVNSSCASTSGETGKGDNYRLPQQSFAYFNRNGSSFPFEEGIVLASSTAQSAIGPFVSDLGTSDSVDWLGDNDLDQILGINSVNATVLEFDFVPLTDYLSFNYIFASNEYQYSYPCEYSDGFAFLIKEVGSTDPYKNLAVIPGTNTPVSSVNVRPQIAPGTGPNGSPYPGCSASNEAYFNGLNNNTSPVNYAGQTAVMTAQSPVKKGVPYHVKLVVADASYRYLDSAVFLQAGSFASKIDFGPNRTSDNSNPLCFGETFLLDPKLSPSYSYKWYRDNVEVATTPTYTVTQSGNYKVEITLTPSSCLLAGEIKIDYAPEILSTDTSLLQCDDNSDGISIFDLTKVNSIVKNNVANITNQGYYETSQNAQDKTSAISGPEMYINKTPNQTVFARLENEFGCFKIAEVLLQIAPTSIPDPSPINKCDEDDQQDGFYQFNLDLDVTPQLLLGQPSQLKAQYYLTANEALAEINKLPNLFTNTTAFNQNIYARVVNGPDCYDVVKVDLVVNTFNPPNFEDESKFLCKNGSLELSVATGFASYSWSTGSTINSTTVTNAGDYTVTVTDNKGCQKTKKFTVILSEPAIITDAVVNDFSGNDNSVLIKYTGAGNYEFSLDGKHFQDDPQFNGIAPGIYNAVALDKNGCGPSNVFPIYVLDYPRFFTPNNDSHNDFWIIENSDKLPEYKIYIFDRYGKLLKQMNQNSSGWSGQFNGQQLPADDYWFTLTFENGKNVKGHFSLIR